MQFNAEDCKQKSVFAINDAHADPGHDDDYGDDVLHYLLMERTTIGAGLIYWEGLPLDAPEDPRPVPQWAGGGLHGGADGSKQVLLGGDEEIRNLM